MHIIDSDQYGTPCVVAAHTDAPDAVMARCLAVGAVREVDGQEFVVQLRSDVGPELWTAESLTRSLLRPDEQAVAEPEVVDEVPTTAPQWGPLTRRIHVFWGDSNSNPHDVVDEWGNCLRIEPSDTDAVDGSTGTVMPLVLVDTNYKPDRTGTHPVQLTLPDAIKAAAGLVGAVLDAPNLLDDGLDASAVLEVLDALNLLDDEVGELRRQLLADLAKGLARANGIARGRRATQAEVNGS